MRSTMEDYNQEIPSSNNNAISFEFHKGSNNNGGGGNRSSSHRRTPLGKPTPSKWDDAQKWLVGLSRGGINGGDKSHGSKPRNSNADDLRLIAPVPHKEEHDYSSGEENEVCEDLNGLTNQYGVETKTVDCEESVWRINKISQNLTSSGGVRSVCVRDMGTEMTPIASQEPSRTATPIRASTPVARSPISSGPPTPTRCQHGSQQASESYQSAGITAERGGNAARRGEEESNGPKAAEIKDSDHARKLNSLETRATAWDDAERAKYMARFKREEVKIQAWENHEKRKAEMEMRKMEVKAERMKARAQEKYANKLAATKRIAEEKRANAEAKLNEKAVTTSEKADYIRRTGHLPSSFSFKLPSLCW